MQATTIWELLTKQNVVIPIIQRDYAQGRKGKEYIRRSFLAQIKSALVEKDKEITLDFVYGNTENESFCPLDGQQRLTTLWLLLWYFIFMNNELNDESRRILKRFTYQTRSSSREFCKKLCEEMNYSVYVESGNPRIADFIKSQTWFFSKWLQDPTVNSMLRTLSGDKQSREDNIEAVFGKLVSLENLNKLKSNIKFYQLNIGSDQLPLSDDLYIKMNARGKGLTHFENFKADLVSWFTSGDNKDKEEFKKEKDNKFLYLYYASQLDGAWTDIFWKSARSNLNNAFNGKIDDSFFAFFNRYIANLICIKNNTPEKDKAFNHICGTGLGKKNSADDSKVKYQGFGEYSTYMSIETIENINTIFEVYQNNKDVINNILEKVNSKNYEDGAEILSKPIAFIPQYKYEKQCISLIPITLSERVYFYSVCLFLETCKTFDEVKFRQWVRIVKNITENSDIDSVARMISCLKSIHKIGMGAASLDWEIYKYLSIYTIDNSDSSSLNRQIKEEKEKAVKIYLNGEIDTYWEEKIICAENFSFFNGSIRFLYRDELNQVQWEIFDEKFANATKLFSKRQDDPVSVKTIYSLLSLFDCFDDIVNLNLFTTIGYHHRNKNWKKDILCNYENKKLLQKVHELLTNSTSGTNKTKEYLTFLNSPIIDEIIKKEGNYKYRCREVEYGFAIQKEYSQSEGVFVGDKYINIFYELCELYKSSIITFDKINKYIEPYYWGKCISIDYNGFHYNWYGSENIYKLNKSGKYDCLKLNENMNFFESLK